MIPTDSNDEYPDIILDLSKDLYQIYKNLIKSLEKGDIINYEGLLLHLGDETSYHMV